MARTALAPSRRQRLTRKALPKTAQGSPAVSSALPTARPLPLLGPLLATLGLLLFGAGLLDLAEPGTPYHTWALPRVADDAAATPRAARDGQRSSRALTAPRQPRDSSEARTANETVILAPTSPSRSAAGDELIPDPSVAEAPTYPRHALMGMSAAQHTGRWTYSCPCPANQKSYPGNTSATTETDLRVNSPAPVGSTSPP